MAKGRSSYRHKRMLQVKITAGRKQKLVDLSIAKCMTLGQLVERWIDNIRVED